MSDVQIYSGILSVIVLGLACWFYGSSSRTLALSALRVRTSRCTAALLEERDALCIGALCIGALYIGAL